MNGVWRWWLLFAVVAWLCVIGLYTVGRWAFEVLAASLAG